MAKTFLYKTIRCRPWRDIINNWTHDWEASGMMRNTWLGRLVGGSILMEGSHSPGGKTVTWWHTAITNSDSLFTSHRLPALSELLSITLSSDNPWSYLYLVWECNFENWLENVETAAEGGVSCFQLKMHKTSTTEATFPLQWKWTLIEK